MCQLRIYLDKDLCWNISVSIFSARFKVHGQCVCMYNTSCTYISYGVCKRAIVGHVQASSGQLLNSFFATGTSEKQGHFFNQELCPWILFPLVSSYSASSSFLLPLQPNTQSFALKMSATRG